MGRRTADEQEVSFKVLARARGGLPYIAIALFTGLAATLQACGSTRAEPSASSTPTLRIGVGPLPAQGSTSGLSQLGRILTIENLARAGEDGRMQPWLAESWTLSEDGRVLKVNLRHGVKFSDGTPLDPKVVAEVLPNGVREQFGPAVFEDVDAITASGSDQIEIRFHRRSMLHLDALEAPIGKPDAPSIGTGAYAAVPNSKTEFRANPDYYLGKPSTDRVSVTMYPSVRAAWAEALRGNLDALYEVGSDALDSFERSTTISTYVFNRRYQHVVAFNARAERLHSPEFRRAINAAIDRKTFVREALHGHGIESSGPLWPQFWAAPSSSPAAAHDLQPGPRVAFSCLVSAEDIDERMALEIKRQLSIAGIDMTLESVSSRQEFGERMAKGTYEAALLELVSGPTLLRPYIVWLSTSPLNPGHLGNPTTDAALERARNAETEDEFKKAVADVQRAFEEDPPAIFLAWNQRARAVSNRFIVPPAQPGRDILSTLRTWKPVDPRRASRN